MCASQPELRPIIGWPGYYAGDDGRIYSTRRHGLHRLANVPSSKYGYPHVGLVRVDGTRKFFTVAVLIAVAFHGPAPIGCEISHLDGDNSNNTPSNLAWETHLENMRRKAEHGTENFGRRNGNWQHSEAKVADIRRLASGADLSQQKIARRLGVSQPYVSLVLRGLLRKEG